MKTLEELNVIVQKKELIAKLKANRERFQKSYKALLKVFNKKAIEYQKKYDEWRRNSGVQGKEPAAPPNPEDRTKDYDFYIKMLNEHAGETIELTETLFRRLWLDKWDWTYSHYNALMFYANAGSTDIANIAADYAGD